MKTSALALLLVLLPAVPALAGWKLVDVGACEGPIVSLSEGLDPAEEHCGPATAGKAAVCYTEICRPHCLYFSFSLEGCQPGADLAKRYVCDPQQ
ncbi:MAG: hypothetical protein AB1899_16265 [Pseudomonadota bacterium]